MKNIKSALAAVLGLSMFVVPMVSIADEIDRSGGGPDLTQLQMSWGLRAVDTPQFAIGASVTDKFGNTYTCPWYIPKSFGGCYDLTKTQYYLSQVHGFLNIK